ncbi:tigger transposable element-derived protein 6 [Ceratobasidium sp. AG-Ba]|nr:tigger transposable element-derived protein 6 [Ceratobasidium sp. AG-Ba]
MTGSRGRLTYEQKVEVIDLYKRHHGQMPMEELLLLLRRKGFATICEQTVRRYVRNEDSIRRYINSNTANGAARRMASMAHPEVEQRFERIKFSDGWLSKFKQRWGLKHYVFHGEAASAPVHTLDEHRRTLHQLLARYGPADRINVDETALPYRQSPTGGLASHALSGLKVDKTRLTYVVGTSQTGEKLKPLVLGRAKRPRCFKNGAPESYGYYYRYNKKAWMTSEIWREYLSNLNADMQVQDRHILLLCDNASSHKVDNGTTFLHLEVAHLPPNVTSWLQPMDAGIIRTFKANYRRLLGLHALDLDARGVEDPYHVDQLDAMRLAQQAWDEVSASTIQNCWRHTGICPEA